MDRQKLYLQFILLFILIFNGVVCPNGELMCVYQGNDGMREFSVDADTDQLDMSFDEAVPIDARANISCGSNDEGGHSFELVAQEEWQILLRISPIDSDDVIVEAFNENYDHVISSENHQSGYPMYLLSETNILKIFSEYKNRGGLNRRFMLNARAVKLVEQHNLQDSTSCYDQERDGQSGAWIYRVTCDHIHPTYDSVLISYRQGQGMSDTYRTIMCEKFHDELPGTSTMPRVDTWPNLSCFRKSTKLVMIVVSAQMQMASDVLIETIVFRGSGEKSERRATLIIVPIVVVIAAILILAFVAFMWCKRRNKKETANADIISAKNDPNMPNSCRSGESMEAENPRYTASNPALEHEGSSNVINRGEESTTYNEIGEQDYHHYYYPDSIPGNTSVGVTTSVESGLYQELIKGENGAAGAVDKNAVNKGPDHGTSSDQHTYQELQRDFSTTNGVRQDGDLPLARALQEAPENENGYQALQKPTPEYATLELPSDIATTPQTGQTLTSSSHDKELPSDTRYEALHQGPKIVGHQESSAGYSTLTPTDETAGDDYETPDAGPRVTHASHDPSSATEEPYDRLERTRPSDASPIIDQPKTNGTVSNPDDDYQTPIGAAEDHLNEYQTLEDQGYHQEPAAGLEDDHDYSHLQRNLGQKPDSGVTNDNGGDNSYGKLQIQR
ncbi:uncharacterized protein LOC121431202 [Lytechinus variegatus]|uniref:uncharacterized protein LOC121431202 n=1 Tax=Lytechinus variegatus TaxID=7654 RepID=UPI001BB2CDBD|nr:uncharacterized protein LOC121431202 [Lytechinus variegatus]